MVEAWFVSDIHIESMEDKKARVFLAFLNSIGHSRNATHLFLVGDIFDLWVGPHDFFIEKFRPIVQRLKELNHSGVSIHYFEGNHDLHLRKFWEGKIGISVHSGPERFQLGNLNVHVEHGDEADPEDKGYLFLRWFLRTPPLKFLSHHLPEKVISWIGNRASNASRDYTSNTKTIESELAVEKLHRHAERVYAEEPFDLLVNGHVHVRDQYQTQNFTAVNLGTWLESPGALHLDNEQWAFEELKDQA